MPIEVHLQPKQELLYDLITATGPDVPTIIGGGGAKGGGKSRGTRSIILQLAGELGELYPGIVITVVRRVYRDPMIIADLEKAVREFLIEVDETVAQLIAKFRQSEAT